MLSSLPGHASDLAAHILTARASATPQQPASRDYKFIAIGIALGVLAFICIVATCFLLARLRRSDRRLDQELAEPVQARFSEKRTSSTDALLVQPYPRPPAPPPSLPTEIVPMSASVLSLRNSMQPAGGALRDSGSFFQRTRGSMLGVPVAGASMTKPSIESFVAGAESVEESERGPMFTPLAVPPPLVSRPRSYGAHSMYSQDSEPAAIQLASRVELRRTPEPLANEHYRNSSAASIFSVRRTPSTMQRLINERSDPPAAPLPLPPLRTRYQQPALEEEDEAEAISAITRDSGVDFTSPQTNTPSPRNIVMPIPSPLAPRSAPDVPPWTPNDRPALPPMPPTPQEEQDARRRDSTWTLGTMVATPAARIAAGMLVQPQDQDYPDVPRMPRPESAYTLASTPGGALPHRGDTPPMPATSEIRFRPESTFTLAPTAVDPDFTQLPPLPPMPARTNTTRTRPDSTWTYATTAVGTPGPPPPGALLSPHVPPTPPYARSPRSGGPGGTPTPPASPVRPLTVVPRRLSLVMPPAGPRPPRPLRSRARPPPPLTLAPARPLSGVDLRQTVSPAVLQAFAEQLREMEEERVEVGSTTHGSHEGAV